MPNDYEDDYRRGRYDRENSDEPYYRSQGGAYEEPYYREPQRHGYGRGGYSSEAYRSRQPGRYSSEPYGAYDHGRYEYGEREPYYQRGYESEYREPYYRGGHRRGVEERGVFERAGDEIRVWFGDEDPDRRRRADEMRRGIYAGRGPRGYQRSDERIHEDINDRLTDDWYIDASDVEVSVNNTMVTLTGRVGSREEKRRAEDIVECVSGVTDVSNQLRVGQSDSTSTETTQTPRVRSART